MTFCRRAAKRLDKLRAVTCASQKINEIAGHGGLELGCYTASQGLISASITTLAGYEGDETRN